MIKPLFSLIFLFSVVALSAQNRVVSTYFDNGSVKSTYRYVNMNNYEVVNYHPNGSIKESGQFINGRMDGSWLSFSEMGIKTGEAFYKAGEKSGEWKVYDDNGKLRFKILYQNNRIASATNYDANGQAIAETHSK